MKALQMWKNYGEMIKAIYVFGVMVYGSLPYTMK